MARTAIIIGAASGMGRATALRLAADGFSVGLADQDTDSLGGLADELRRTNASQHAVRIDIADATCVEQGIQELAHQLGPPWLLARRPPGDGHVTITPKAEPRGVVTVHPAGSPTALSSATAAADPKAGWDESGKGRA